MGGGVIDVDDPGAVKAKIRDDFIRRLFAVAVSVGFASSISQMEWIKEARTPNIDEFKHVAVLLAALFATVLSWDGYLYSIHRKPLRLSSRFVIDIILVFTYMVLLLTARNLLYWPYIIASMFILYIAWDILTINEYYCFYDKNAENGHVPSLRDVVSVYTGVFTDSKRYAHGPISTVSWSILCFGVQV